MIPQVLIVDPDQGVLESARISFEQYGKIFQLLTASTAADAALALNNESLSLLVVDVDTSSVNGPPFLDYVTRRYPLLPVIVTGQPESLNASAQEVGRRYLACLRKPFEVHHLAEKVLVAIDWEADGGTLHDISTFIVPQMIEIEKKTCAVKVTRLSSFRHGILFFSDGVLIEAFCEGETGEAAAYTILSWDKVKVVINNSCSVRERRIHSPVSAILLEAMRLRDESEEEASEGAGQDRPGEPRQDKKTRKADGDPPPSKEAPAERVRAASVANTLLQTLARTRGVEDVYQDNMWDAFTEASARLGRAFSTGAPRLVFVSGDRLDSDLILLPAKRTVVVTIDKLSRRDDMIEKVLTAISG
jgi:FixJ family two-component response regulator